MSSVIPLGKFEKVTLGNPRCMTRITYFDGLRGIACLMVLVCHYNGAFAPCRNLGFLGCGEGAVALFFLMSGYVLTGSFEKTATEYAGNVARRLLRLGVPTMAAIWVAAAFALTGHQAAHKAALLAWSRPLLEHSGAPTLPSLRYDLSGAPILFGYSGTGLFNWPWLPKKNISLDSPIWTLSVEIWGSIWVVVLVGLRRYSRLVYAAALLASVFLIGVNELALFTIGHLCASWRPRANAPLGIALITAGAWLFSRYVSAAAGIPAFLPRGVLAYYNWFHWQVELGALLIFAGVLLTPWVQTTLCRPLPRYLGRLSFSTYLLHYPIMVLVGPTIFLAVAPAGHDLAAVVALVVGTAITLAAATLFERYVDSPGVQLSRRTKRKHLRVRLRELGNQPLG